ncbi:5-formyltetrahydrofolate cyclo-ligase [Novosphingobium colocasiae]|uniref:5-formyltetrahydrofolate cyclo-ligase n=1 Tax=Novosphingobium colocasiae TaxID=1256513 RepID=A0A918UH89_9SPHN|nr:5-formyltetrahydrofolate cyclo-ligase [Novosphingobium colocasiae]GGZ08853.1 5-formyltetrahydrofolate cyclo-ligase [Novosphingobium colocasiae]
MVDPSPPANTPPIDAVSEKARLRAHYRKARRDQVEALPQALRALVLNRPPAPVAALFTDDAPIGLYHPVGAEAPTLGWARWLIEQGHTIALPWFAARDDAMHFRRWSNPFDEDELAPGPWKFPQPSAEAEEQVPGTVIVPLVAFTADGHRLGQGAGHYDRWLARHPQTRTIGLAWDCQLADTLPWEGHDRMLDMIVTPTRIYEGQS